MPYDYEERPYRRRAYWSAIGLALIWHAFWLFSIKVRVNPETLVHKTHPKVVFLGPVLDDQLFRTLADTKPELSQTFYRRLSDYSSPIELEKEKVERVRTGEVVSVDTARPYALSEFDALVDKKAFPGDAAEAPAP